MTTEEQATDAALAAERKKDADQDAADAARIKELEEFIAQDKVSDEQLKAAYDLRIKTLQAELDAILNPVKTYSFGTCIHSTFRTSIYANDAKVLECVKKLGAKFYRDLLSMTSYRTEQAKLFKLYGAAGIKGHLTCGTYKTLSGYNYQNVVTNLKAIGVENIAEVAGVNEPDDSDNGGAMSNWLPVVKAHQTKLYDAVKGDAATKNIPVGLGALRWNNGNKWVENAEMAKACAGKFDFFNLHFYPGKGSNVLNELTLAVKEIRKFTDKPIIISEGGGTTANMTLEEQARICVDLIKAGEQLGVKVYLYECMDDPNPAGTDVQSNFGSFESNFEAKPSAIAVAKLAA